MGNDGWIRLYRQIQKGHLWLEKPFDKGRAWVDLLLLANYEDVEIYFNGELVLVTRGQLITSIRRLSERWGWSKDKVLRFLDMLEKEGMIKRQSDANRTLVTIVNYGIYQGDCDSEKPLNQRDTNEDTNRDTNRDANRASNRTQQTVENKGFADIACDTNKDTDKDSDKDTNRDRDKDKTKNIKKKRNINIINNMCKNEAFALFERLWKLYPNKRGKGQVSDTAKKRLLSIGEDEMKRAIERYKRDLEHDKDWRRPQNGSTFFNSGYVDYLDANYVEKGVDSSEKEDERPGSVKLW